MVMSCSLFWTPCASVESEIIHLPGGTPTLILSTSVPGLLNYQGYLADAGDSSAVTTALEMTFRLFDSETKGAELWSETHPAVEVAAGLFQVMLGGVTAFPEALFDGTPLWLQTEVGAEILMPRKPLVSVGFSMRSGTADLADTADFAAHAGNAVIATEALHATHADTAQYSYTASVGFVDSAATAGNAHHLQGQTLVDLDGRWVQQGQANAVTSSMIEDGQIARIDAATDFKAPYADTADYALGATGAMPPVPLMLSGASNQPILRVANEGAGHGVAVDSAQGYGVSIDSAGADGIHIRQAGTASASNSSSSHNGLEIEGAAGSGLYVGHADQKGVYVYNSEDDGICIRSTGSPTGGLVSSGSRNGLEVYRTEGYGIYIGRANRSGMRIYEAGEPSAGVSGPGLNGFEVRGAENCGLYVGHADSAGVLVNSSGDHGFAALEPVKDGLYVSIAGDCGVQVDSSSNDGIYVRDCSDDGIHVFNAHDDGIYLSSCNGCGVYVSSPGDDGIHITGPDDDGVYVAGPADDGVYVISAGGHGGYFDLTLGSSGWAVYAHSTGSTGNGIYCYGNGTITGAWSKTVATSKGWEAVQTLSAPDEEIVASGTGRLTNGRCRVNFERLFSESISAHVPIKVVVTPMDQWSGLYTTERSYLGFTVLTGAGAQDAAFTWQAIGRRQGYEQRPRVTIPDPDEEEMAEVEEPNEDEYRNHAPRLRAQRDRTDLIVGPEGEFIEPVRD
jgi:hypothetical protein